MSKFGRYICKLRLDLQAGAGDRRLDDVEAAARHAEVHVLAVAHLDVQPVDAGRFQFLDLRAQHRIIRPEEPGGDFAFLC